MKQSVWLVFVGVVALGCGGSQSSNPGRATPVPSPTPPPSTENTPSGAKEPAPANALEVACRQKARDVEGEQDSSRLVRCPPGCRDMAGSVWGTNIYTDDSVVCGALVHAGALPESGGVARITFVRGLQAYVGSERNGIKSLSYGKWRRSFYAQSIGDDGQPTTPAATLPDENTARVDCSHRGSVVGTQKGASLTIICPGGCADGSFGLWGSNPYTADSNVCAAAIHAGTIPSTGGQVVVTLVEGQPSYAGSTKNGILARDYGKYGLSFTVANP